MTSLAGSRAAGGGGGDDDNDEVYDDVNIEPAPVIQRPTTTDTTTMATTAAADVEAFEDELIYECCDDVVTTSRDPVTSQTNMAAGDDYANMYYGRWDNAACDDKELSFRRGDVLHIVSRQYDAFGWWVGALNGSVGLVPRDYLSPAYQLADT